MAFAFTTDTDPTRLRIEVGTTPITPFDSGACVQFWYFHDSAGVNTSAFATLFSLNADSPGQESCLNIYLPDANTLSLERWDALGNGGFIDAPISDGWHRICVLIVDTEVVNFYIDDDIYKLTHSPGSVYAESVLMEMGSRSFGDSTTYGMGAGAVADIKIFRNVPDFYIDTAELLNQLYFKFPRLPFELAMWTPLTFQHGMWVDPTDYGTNFWTWSVSGGADVPDPWQTWAEDDDTLYWPPTQTLDPSGVASDEAVGLPRLAHEINFDDAPAIGSSEAVGTPSLAATLDPSGVASEEAIGAMSLALALDPSGVASEEAIGSPSLAIAIDPQGVASEEAVGLPILRLTNVEILQLQASIGSVLLAAGIGPGVAASAARFAITELVRAGKIGLLGPVGDLPAGTAPGGGLQFLVSFPQE